MYDTGISSRLRRPSYRAAAWDGERHVISEARRAWASARILVRHEDIRRWRTWSDVLKEHTIIVNLGGATHSFEAELEGGMRSLQPPTAGYMSVLPAGRAFSGCFQGHSTAYAICEIGADTLARLAEEADLPRPTELFPRLSHRDDVIHTSIRQLRELAQSNDNLGDLQGETLARSLALHLIEGYGCNAGAPASPALKRSILTRKVVWTLQDYMDENLPEKIRLEDLATVAGQSVHNLLLGFRQRFGETPYQYIVAQRLKGARWQLAHTRKPISAIAYDLGFSSQSHLTSTFTQRFGMPPRAFRNSLT